MGFPSLPRIELFDAFMCLYALPAVMWEGLFYCVIVKTDGGEYICQVRRF
jgi:hypothetical protein